MDQQARLDSQSVQIVGKVDKVELEALRRENAELKSRIERLEKILESK